MSYYNLFCSLNNDAKRLSIKNPHTLHFFCYHDNIKILNREENNSKLVNGYKYDRVISNKLADNFNISNDLVKDLYFQYKLNFKLDNNYPKLEYQDRRQRPTTTLHLGQTKLFVCTLHFLINNVPKDKEVHILYPGSASGRNIHLLSKFFPNIYWYLIDPLPFYEKMHTNPKILYMSNKYFTDKDAEYFKKKLKNKYTIFISDIRLADQNDLREIREIRVHEDQIKQYKWCKIFNADISLLKFRIPRFCENYNYFDGEIFLQPFAPHTSTETRLVVKKNAKDKVYSLNDYEDKLYYHNRILRVANYSRVIKDKVNFFDGCFDCSYFIFVIKEYIIKYNSNLSLNEIINKIFNELENFNKFKLHSTNIINNII